MSEALSLDFVLVPAGEFRMGSDLISDRMAETDEMPGHCLLVSDFYIMRYPVTNAQYQRFVEATGYRTPQFGWPEGKFPAEKADHPVVGVSFIDAAAFCHWAAEVTGLPVRLPTEPEWEKAARGPDGRIYPWGNGWEAGRCNSSEAKVRSTSPVGMFSPLGNSPYGIGDMNGNVQQWCSSLFGRYPYDPTDGREALVYADKNNLMPLLHETGCTSDVHSLEANLGKTVLRGGSWREAQLKSRCAYRSWAAPMHRSDDTGFRCCYEP